MHSVEDDDFAIDLASNNEIKKRRLDKQSRGQDGVGQGGVEWTPQTTGHRPRETKERHVLTDVSVIREARKILKSYTWPVLEHFTSARYAESITITLSFWHL